MNMITPALRVPVRLSRRADRVALFDASAGALPAWLSFSRTTTGTFIDAAGVMRTAAINAPRFDYSTGAAGLLVEPQATNLALHSDTLAGDTLLNLTNSAAGVTLPNGLTGGVKLAETAVNGNHYSARSFAQGGGTYAQFFILRAAERSWACVESYVSAFSAAFFDLQNGVVGTIIGAEISTAGVRNLANDWKLCWVVGTKPSGALNFFISPAPSDGTWRPSYLGIVGSGILVAGRQVEAGSFASSYIITTTAAVARSADIATLLAFTNNPAKIDATNLVTGVRSVTNYQSGIGATLPVNLRIHRVEIYRLGTTL